MSRRADVRSFFVSFLAAFCFFLPGCRDEGGVVQSVSRQSRLPPSAGDSDGRLEQALLKITAGSYDEARVIIAAVLSDHPGSCRGRFLEAFTWHRQKRYEKARKGFEAVLRSRAGFAGSENVLHFYGWALYHLGRLGEAEEAFRAHAKEAPQVASTWFALGLIALEDHRLGEAESLLDKARWIQDANSKKQKELAKTMARLGEVHILQGRLELARKDLEEAVRIWPGHFNAHYKLYRVLLRLGEKEAAQAALKRHQALAEAPGERRTGS
jgi:Tfp pilus assembly protein PilF